MFQVKPSHIYAEEEVEYNLRKLATTVESSLSAVPFSWGNPEFIFWRTPFYDFKVVQFVLIFDFYMFQVYFISVIYHVTA